MTRNENNMLVGNLLKAARIVLYGKRSERRRMRLEMARICTGFFGDHYLGDDNKRWRHDKEFLDIYNRLSPKNPYSQERKYTLQEFVRFVASARGDMAECGCYTGASAYFMARTAPDISLYLFDSFEGLSTPGPQDATQIDTHAWKAGDMMVSESILRQNLSCFANIHILKGWIPERFHEVAERKFRLVHVDVDLYEPTIECLRFFYPRLSLGGVIVLDDYGFTTCPGAFHATHEYMADKPEHVVHLPTGQGIIIRCSDPAESAKY